MIWRYIHNRKALSSYLTEYMRGRKDHCETAFNLIITKVIQISCLRLSLGMAVSYLIFDPIYLFNISTVVIINLSLPHKVSCLTLDKVGTMIKNLPVVYSRQ